MVKAFGGNMLRILTALITIIIFVAQGAQSQTISQAYFDSVLNVVINNIDSVGVNQNSIVNRIDSLNALLRNNIDSLMTGLRDSLKALKNGDGTQDSLGGAKFVVTIFGGLVGILALMQALLVVYSNIIRKQSEEALKQSETKIKTVERKLKQLVDDSSTHVEYFLKMFNNIMPEEDRIEDKHLAHAINLVSFDPKVRFVAISALGAIGDMGVVPYLEWVKLNRRDSKEEADKAIEEIKGRNKSQANGQ
jgi:hypothetical protein